jgi:hypothetical protein
VGQKAHRAGDNPARRIKLAFSINGMIALWQIGDSGRFLPPVGQTGDCGESAPRAAGEVRSANHAVQKIAVSISS